jgi:hypothetical protein
MNALNSACSVKIKMIVLFETLLVNNTHTCLLLLRVGIFNKPEEK